jgi:hypothetical protein
MGWLTYLRNTPTAGLRIMLRGHPAGVVPLTGLHLLEVGGAQHLLELEEGIGMRLAQPEAGVGDRLPGHQAFDVTAKIYQLRAIISSTSLRVW